MVEGLKVDQHTPEKYKELQTAFIKYNDRQDQFRNVKKTWRELLPELEKSISKA